jgi:hypothetical protein
MAIVVGPRGAVNRNGGFEANGSVSAGQTELRELVDVAAASNFFTALSCAEKVGGVHGDVESGIVEGALRALHPVDDTLALGERLATTANGDARISGKMLKSQLSPISGTLG